MLKNDGVLFWKHATRKKWAEKHSVRRILRIVYKIGSFEVRMAYAMISYGMHVPGTIPQYAMYAPPPAMPYTGTANTGDCCKKLACLLEMIAQCGDPELCGKALELCSGFQKRCKLSNWQWYEKNVLSSSQMRIRGSHTNRSLRETRETFIRNDPLIIKDGETEDVWGQQVVGVQAGCAGTEEVKNLEIIVNKTEEQAKEIVSKIGTKKKIERVAFADLKLSEECQNIFAKKIENFDEIEIFEFTSNNFDGTQIFNAISKSAWQSLNYLIIDENFEMSDMEIQSLVKSITSQALKKIISFNISNSNLNRTQVNDIITCLGGSPVLSQLFLMNYKKEQKFALERLPFLPQKCQELEYLDLSQNEIDEMDVDALTVALPLFKKLKKFCLVQCSITKENLQKILECFSDCKSLKEVKLSSFLLEKNLVKNMVDEIKKKCKDIKFEVFDNEEEYIAI